MFSNDNTKFIILAGYNNNPGRDRQVAKRPVSSWQNPENQYSYNEALEVASSDNWIGMICPSHALIADIDTPEGIAWLEANLDLFGFVQKTKNGYHVATLADQNITGATHEVAGGFRVTFRAPGKNYIVVAPSDGYHVIKDGSLLPLPLDLFPIAKTEKATKTRTSTKSSKKCVEKKSGKFYPSLSQIILEIEAIHGRPEIISEGTFDAIRRLQNAGTGRKHETRLTVAKLWTSWALAGSVSWAEWPLVLRAAMRSSDNPGQALRDMIDGSRYVKTSGYAQAYKPSHPEKKDPREVRRAVKSLVATKAKEAGPDAQCVVVSAQELAKIAPLNCATMQNLIRKYRVRRANRNVYIIPILRSRPNGIRALFTASIVPVVITRKPKSTKATQSKIEGPMAKDPRAVVEAMQLDNSGDSEAPQAMLEGGAEALRAILWASCYLREESDTRPIRGPDSKPTSDLTYRLMSILEGVR